MKYAKALLLMAVVASAVGTAALLSPDAGQGLVAPQLPEVDSPPSPVMAPRKEEVRASLQQDHAQESRVAKASLAAGLVAHDVLPVFEALRQQRRPGSFVASQELLKFCLSAKLMELDYRNQVATDTSGRIRTAAREEAAQRIEQRCMPIVQLQDRNHALADDPYAGKLKALQQIHAGEGFAALMGPFGQELIAQGQLVSAAMDYLRVDATDRNRYFEGILLESADNIEAFNRALEISRSRLPLENAQSSASSLTDLMGCVGYGQCSGNDTEYVFRGLPSDSPIRSKALIYLPRVIDALRHNDLKPFLPPR